MQWNVSSSKLCEVPTPPPESERRVQVSIIAFVGERCYLLVNVGLSKYLDCIALKHLLDIGFTQSQHDECLFYCGTITFILYIDDSIILGPIEAEIDSMIDKMKQAGLDLTVAGKLETFWVSTSKKSKVNLDQNST